MYYFVIFTLIFASVAASGSGPPRFDSTADDCCALTWEPVIDGGDRRFIPSTAIPFGMTPFNSTVYFARKADAGVPQVGAINDALEAPVYIRPLDNAQLTVQGWNNTFVLANPNNCDLKWQDSVNQLFNRTAALEFPSIDGYLFAKTHDTVNDSYVVVAPMRGGMGRGIYMKYADPVAASLRRYQVLTIDCASSLRKIIKAELFDIEFDTKALVNESEGLRVISHTEVINDSDFDQEANIAIDSEVLSSLQMSHEVQLYSLMETTWGVHASVNLNFLGQLIGLGFTISADFSQHTAKTNFTRTGEISFEARRRQFKYNEDILIKAMTKSIVTMNTQPIGGSMKFKAHYKIVSPKANDTITLAHASHLLRRQGFPGWDKLIEDKSGAIVFTVDGYMELDTGVDTHVVIESTPLTNTSGLRHTSRVVRGLDQLSLPSSGSR